jgi:hypothetical protein
MKYSAFIVEITTEPLLSLLIIVVAAVVNIVLASNI